MAVRPNFTGVELTTEVVRVFGQSAADFQDIVDIRVVLSQDEHIDRKIVRKLGTEWDVEFPAAGFGPGAAAAFGVETRMKDATTTTWAQTLQIPKLKR